MKRKVESEDHKSNKKNKSSYTLVTLKEEICNLVEQSCNLVEELEEIVVEYLMDRELLAQVMRKTELPLCGFVGCKLVATITCSAFYHHFSTCALHQDIIKDYAR